MSTPLKVTESARVRLAKLFQAQNEAIAKLPEVHAWTHAFAASLEMLGLDANVQGHSIDFQTGVITPASTSAKPTLVKEEVAS